jgi:superfamily II DNA or RNA helicase
LPPWPHLEFHRCGIGLVPFRDGGSAAGADSAFYIHRPPGSPKPLRSCTCADSRKTTCGHMRDLGAALPEVERTLGGLDWEASFSRSAWYRLAKLLVEGERSAVSGVEVKAGPGEALRFVSAAGGEMVRYLEPSADRERFLERLGKGSDGTFDRAGLLARLALFQKTPEERVLERRGARTIKQTWEESFWHLLAYHAVREWSGGTFHPAIDRRDGRFTLTFRLEGQPKLRFTVPRDRVASVLGLLLELQPEQPDLPSRPIPLQSILRATAATELDLPGPSVRRAIRTLQAAGEERIVKRAKLRYGNLVYLPELGVLAELERAGHERKFRAPVSMKLEKSRIASFEEEAADDAEARSGRPEPSAERQVFRDYDRLELRGDERQPRKAGDTSGPAPPAEEDDEALGRRWGWMSAAYGFGGETVPLFDLLQARREGLPYFELRGGWVDLHAPAFREAERLLGAGGEEKGLTLLELLRLQASAGAGGKDVRLAGSRIEVLERLLAGRPAESLSPLAGLRSVLRPYQARGVDWLRFLWENRLGGLLCDDMGLGKTHQLMALMVALSELQGVAAPFLVVCPTSVLPHWRDKIRDFAPGLRSHLFHGPQRRLPARLRAGDVVLTSYGVLRRSAGDLSAIPFAVAAFDEVQHVKNPGTLAYRAAAELTAEVRFGVTGTPIENALGDLKTLFDLVLPGYLGSDTEFDERYGEVSRPRDNDKRRTELRRAIAPFVLRRLKSTVLDELPEKIEDVRKCALSEDQVKLYRDAVAGQGAELVRQLEEAESRIPYIHVFALLNRLKQICDHPALALGREDEAAAFRSGKWDLFTELLDECLGSGQKVVVFTQFLGMIRLMERHLAAAGVEFATLTGASANRGALIDRFNLDPDCRVFLGSLKAGGTGIDLIGGSVVIHYDRWWNAAREDQATDRVYRLGQKRAVQVFKLVTEGTLEEKIAALIDRKRRMMADVVEEDDPHLAKVFSRDELIEMLAPV